MIATLKRDTWIGLVTIVLAAGYLTQIGSIHVRPGADVTGVGPRTYPTLLGWVLLLTGIALVVTSVVGTLRRAADATAGPDQSSAEVAPSQRRRLIQGAALAGLTVVYLLMLEPLGFLIATVPYIAGAMVIVDAGAHYRGRQLWVPLVTGALLSLALHALFHGALGVPLPPGPFDPAWGI